MCSHPGGTVNLRLGSAALAAMFALSAASANAQITTVVAAPPQPKPNQQQVAQRQQAARDSVAHVTLTAMTQWVDSAAKSLALRPDTGTVSARDTAIAQSSQPPAPQPPSPAQKDSTQRDSSRVRSSAGGDVQFKNGARAPNTATFAPTLALLGVAMITLGVFLRRRPHHENARVRRG